jgi:peptidoglycan/xylan/chitin deacetylase (PgdA/CDA1 family)
MNNKKKIILLFLPIIVIVCLSLLFREDFHLKYFKNQLEIEVGTPFLLKDFEVCYGNYFRCQQATFKMISEEIDTTKLGSYQVKYKLSYENQEKEISQEIDIVDHTPPLLEINSDDLMICQNGKILNVETKATDNLDGDITNQISYHVEQNEIVFEVLDRAGNKTEKRILAKPDNVFPEIKLKGEKFINIKQNTEYQELGATAIDNCDGDLTENIIITGEVNTKVLGEYHITYQVQDSNGNNSKTERIINVQEENKYVGPTGKNIYLTFDDGPGPYTGDLLDILQKYHVKATFFVTNQGLTKGYDHFIKRAYEEGHTIGLHTSNHDYKTIYQSEEAYFKDLFEIQKKVKDITGYESKIIRFPGGSSNTISKFNPGIMSRLAKEVEQKGFRYFDWNLDSDDAGRAKNMSMVSANVIKGLGSGTHYVVLQHDIKKYSVEAVEAIIQYGLSHGFQFRALTMDSPSTHHRINN